MPCISQGEAHSQILASHGYQEPEWEGMCNDALAEMLRCVSVSMTDRLSLGQRCFFFIQCICFRTNKLIVVANPFEVSFVSSLTPVQAIDLADLGMPDDQAVSSWPYAKATSTQKGGQVSKVSQYFFLLAGEFVALCSFILRFLAAGMWRVYFCLCCQQLLEARPPQKPRCQQPPVPPPPLPPLPPPPPPPPSTPQPSEPDHPPPDRMVAPWRRPNLVTDDGADGGAAVEVEEEDTEHAALFHDFATSQNRDEIMSLGRHSSLSLLSLTRFGIVISSKLWTTDWQHIKCQTTLTDNWHWLQTSAFKSNQSTLKDHSVRKCLEKLGCLIETLSAILRQEILNDNGISWCAQCFFFQMGRFQLKGLARQVRLLPLGLSMLVSQAISDKQWQTWTIDDWLTWLTGSSCNLLKESGPKKVYHKLGAADLILVDLYLEKFSMIWVWNLTIIYDNDTWTYQSWPC